LVWAMAIISGLPTLALGVLAAAAARHWVVLVGAAAAAVLGPAALHFFEAGTHGRWYIQSEGLALLLSVAVGSAVWLLCFGTGTLAWGYLARRKRRASSGVTCGVCGYDLRGLPNAGCPECGAGRERGIRPAE